ncbi:MAG: GatB/YqeY domain-containing protein [Gammaproteobacteria bacterium]
MSLLDTINQDLKTAMISKEVVARDTIRMLLSEIKKYEIDEREEATDAIILTLINKNVKQRRDSIEQFKNGGRADLVTKEEEQLNIILQYLPQQLSADEIKVIVQQGIDEISAKTMQDMGKLMGLLKPQLEGKADMSIVSASVKELLN